MPKEIDDQIDGAVYRSGYMGPKINDSSSDLKNRNIQVTAMTYASDEYDTEPEEVSGILFTRPSPFGSQPQCWVNGIQVDPSTVRPVKGKNDTKVNDKPSNEVDSTEDDLFE